MPPLPSAPEIASIYLDLLTRRKNRSEAAAWAKSPMHQPPDVADDDPLLHALDCLASADHRTADGRDLYSEDDFKSWLFILNARPEG